MENINVSKSITEGAKTTPSIIEKKRRKTLDEYLGINGLLIIAIMGVLIRGGIVEALGNVSLVTAIYFLIKRRKIISKNQKYIGWLLVILWLILFGINNQMKLNNQLQ